MGVAIFSPARMHAYTIWHGAAEFGIIEMRRFLSESTLGTQDLRIVIDLSLSGISTFLDCSGALDTFYTQQHVSVAVLLATYMYSIDAIEKTYHAHVKQRIQTLSL